MKNVVAKSTVKLGDNDQGYNEFTVTKNKFKPTFLVPSVSFVT